MRTILNTTLVIGIATGNAIIAATPFAQNYPAKPVRIVVPNSAGGPTDALARIISTKMSESWGQPVVVENRPGAGGVLGQTQVAKSAPDGYTLMLVGGGFIISSAVQSNLPYDPIKDFAGVTQLGFPTAVLIAAPALGVKSVKDLIALSKAQPGKILYGSGGAGGGPHLNAERIGLAAGIKLTHVGFKGQPEALVEVLAGRVHFAVLGLTVVQPFLKDGRLLPLAVFIPQRSPLLPEVPSITEALPGVERGESWALLAPARTPRPILAQINKEIMRVLALPDVKERMQVTGFVPAPSTPEEQDKIRRDQIDALTKLVIGAGLRSK